MINSKEHEVISKEFTNEQLKLFNKSFNSNKLQDKQKYLGLHQEFDNNEIKLKSYYYIGYKWLDKKSEEYIHISPKKSDDGSQADYLEMFLECLKDPIVSKHLDDTFKIYPNEKWIEIEEEKINITPFIIFSFLKLVNSISKKGLKKGYIKVTENLTSKIKGRILVNQTIKENHFRNRLDKTVCNHQIFTINCIENQILKTALLQCSRNLQGIQNSDIAKLLKQNLNSFELVDKREVFSTDFSKIKHSPFYKEYKEALELAKMIFKRFGFTLNSSKKEQKIKIPPFYIDMPELFERYVEVKLRKAYPNNLKAFYGIGNGYKTSIGELRPDFIVKDKGLIIDAKYKYWFSDDNDKRFKDDFQQLALYGRVKKVRDDIGLKNSAEEAKILFIYPIVDKYKYKDKDKRKCTFLKSKDFNNIRKIGVSIHVK